MGNAPADRPEVTPSQAFLADPRIPPLVKYRRMAVGLDRGWGYLLKYELATGLLGPLPGVAGYFLRQKLYPSLFRAMGSGVTLGRNVTLRHPGRISLGRNVNIDENVLLQACDGEIAIGDGTIIGANSLLVTRGGSIRIGPNCNIGSGVRLGTTADLVLEEYVLVAANCYVGAGSHRHDRLDVPIISQGMEESRGTTLKRGVWLGAGAIVLDGVTVGADAIVGAASLVKRDVPDLAVVAGQPARLLRYRDGRPAGGQEPPER